MYRHQLDLLIPVMRLQTLFKRQMHYPFIFEFICIHPRFLRYHSLIVWFLLVMILKKVYNQLLGTLKKMPKAREEWIITKSPRLISLLLDLLSDILIIKQPYKIFKHAKIIIHKFLLKNNIYFCYYHYIQSIYTI